ncbi:hypothetical protein [Leucobacter sp. cx-169]|uniref:hypothetical protein n=1 Tax=Leucobacter sp. cx-169 TaxID=2770549 RepID=UPI00165D8B0B|nr:hypothetical protein [Leucobacter sp. cx-169]MBC9927185.1 hypothetical protein [Leucobacter sp. cx-169]
MSDFAENAIVVTVWDCFEDAPGYYRGEEGVVSGAQLDSKDGVVPAEVRKLDDQVDSLRPATIDEQIQFLASEIFARDAIIETLARRIENLPNDGQV